MILMAIFHSKLLNFPEGNYFTNIGISKPLRFHSMIFNDIFFLVFHSISLFFPHEITESLLAKLHLFVSSHRFMASSENWVPKIL